MRNTIVITVSYVAMVTDIRAYMMPRLLYFGLKPVSVPAQAPRSHHQISRTVLASVCVYQMFPAVVVVPRGLISQRNACKRIKRCCTHTLD